jgi:hypothetical protein
MSTANAKFDPAAFCSQPLVRRVYLALASALAVFLATLAILREPFRGYLGEVHIVGPVSQGLDLDDAARWLKRTEPSAVVLTDRNHRHTLAGGRSQIRMTYLAPRPAAVRLRLDDLSTRWLYQYLPEQLQAFRREALSQTRSVVTAARDREDAARTRVEELRQKQLARYFQQPSFPQLTAAETAPQLHSPAALVPADSNELRTQLDKLRMELARLLASFTDEHPQVITLHKQITGLETQLGLPSGGSLPGSGPELVPAPPGDSQASGQATSATHLVSTNAASSTSESAAQPETTDLSASISAALLELAQAGRQRQVAEQRQTDRMQELSNEPTAADWSAEPAHIVTRLGGTPRLVTLALGGLLACVAGIVMFRASAVAVVPPRIHSASELAAALEIPVIGNASRLRTAADRIRQRLLKPAYVLLVGHLAEGVIALAAVACILSIAVEPTLAGQVVADPFGTLSEVMGRFVSSR